MSWSYDNIVPEQASAEQAVQAEVVPETVHFTAEEAKLVQGASVQAQQAIISLLSAGPLTAERKQAVFDLVANDAMIASPTGQGLSNDIGLISQQQEQGRTTYSDQDLELLKIKVQNLVKSMPNATDTEIQQAVANFAPAELQQYAQGVAQQQLDAEKFNIFASRPVEGQQQSNEFGGVFAAVVGGAVAGTAVARMQGIDAAPMEVVDLGSSTAYIASLANGFVPSQVQGFRDRSQDRDVSV